MTLPRWLAFIEVGVVCRNGKRVLHLEPTEVSNCKETNGQTGLIIT